MDTSNSAQGEQKAQVVQATPTNKPFNKKILIIIIGAVLLICCCVVVVLFFIFMANSSVSTSDYLGKTEAPYTDVKAQMTKVSDSILNYYAVDSTGEKYADISTKVNTAYTLAADLDTKINTAQSAIPAAGSEAKGLDANLKDYYTSGKNLATSYKNLLNVEKQTLPVVKDIEDMSALFASFPTTAQDFTNFGNQLTTQSTKLKADATTIANIQTTSENEFVKTAMANLLSASNDFIAAFITYTENSGTAIQNNDATALTAAETALTAAGNKFQTATADTTAKDKKALLVATYKTQLSQITTKQDQVDSELTKVKALAK